MVASEWISENNKNFKHLFAEEILKVWIKNEIFYIIYLVKREIKFEVKNISNKIFRRFSTMKLLIFVSISVQEVAITLKMEMLVYLD